MMFTGFPEATVQFFLDIRFHNNIAYFEENRARYERDVKAPFEAFIQELAPAMLSIDPQMELRPYRCMARLRRDVRFTKDKSPFRDHLWVLFRHADEPREGSVMYWFELAPSGMNWGAGTWGENRQMMDILRRRIVADPDGVRNVIKQCHLTEHHMLVGGSSFKRLEVPAGVPDDLKGWYALREVYISPESTASVDVHSPQLTKRVQEDFLSLSPLYHLLRGAYEAVPPEEVDKMVQKMRR